MLMLLQTDLHRLGLEYWCDEGKYPLSEDDIHENKIAWLLRRTAIRKNGGCGETAQYDHDTCFMCDKDIAETKVECANCYLTYCGDCFGEGMDGCEECNDIMYADSDDEEEEEEQFEFENLKEFGGENEIRKHLKEFPTHKYCKECECCKGCDCCICNE